MVGHYVYACFLTVCLLACSLLRNVGCLPEDFARKYIAETILALEYCHTQVRVYACAKVAGGGRGGGHESTPTYLELGI